MKNRQKFNLIASNLEKSLNDLSALLDEDDELRELFNDVKGYPFNKSLEEIASDWRFFFDRIANDTRFYK